MNGENEKRIAEMTDAELVLFALSAQGDYLQDDSTSVDFGLWLENS